MILKIEALMVVFMEIAVFWDVMLYKLVDHYKCLGAHIAPIFNHEG
jgi:hypothetical protein